MQHNAHIEAFNLWFRTISEPELITWITRTGYWSGNSGGARRH